MTGTQERLSVAKAMARERKGSKMHSKVVNPYFPGQEHYFNLSPREAVIAAFALYTMGNPVESQWEELYGSTAATGERTLSSFPQLSSIVS
jgi:hypothetical protein